MRQNHLGIKTIRVGLNVIFRNIIFLDFENTFLSILHSHTELVN